LRGVGRKVSAARTGIANRDKKKTRRGGLKTIKSPAAWALSGA